MLTDSEKEKLSKVREGLILLCDLKLLKTETPAGESMVAEMYDLVSDVLGKERHPAGQRLSGAIGFVKALKGK